MQTVFLITESLDLSLVVTIVGWFVVALLQVFILQRDRNYQKELEAFRIVTPKRLLKLEECSDWVIRGNKLAFEYQNALIRRAEKSHGFKYGRAISQIKSEFVEWQMENDSFSSFAYGIWDKKFKGNLGNKITSYSNEMNTLFFSKQSDVINRMKDEAANEELGEFSYLYNQELVRLHFELLMDLDTYIGKAYKLETA